MDNLGDTVVDTKVVDKTFTQEQINAIVAREVKSAKEAMLKDAGIGDFNNLKDGMVKYNEWLNTQKTESQRLSDERDNYKKQYEEQLNKAKDYETTMGLLNKGVKQDCLTDFGVLVKATGEEDFEKAFGIVSTKYPTMIATSDSGGDTKKDDNKGGAGASKPKPFGTAIKGSASEAESRLAAMRARAGLK